MGLHEEKKTGKIIDELILFLLRKGHNVINMKIEYTPKKQTIITIEVNKCLDKIKTYMLKYINQKREHEVEEYGWEIMGESDQSNELEMVGLLVDLLTIEDIEDKSVLKLIRKH